MPRMDRADDLFSNAAGEPAATPTRNARTAAARGRTPAVSPPGSYTAADIEVLEGLEPVRRRPGMYIGGTDEKALHHLFAEVHRQLHGRGGRRPRQLDRGRARRRTAS